MRVLIRTTKLAIWARWLASLAVPLTLLPVILHYAGYVQSPVFEITALFAAGVSTLALFLAVAAFVRLWFTGDRGWGGATLAFLVSAACLVPVAVAGYAYLHYPLATDIATVGIDPPPLVSALPPPPGRLPGADEIARAYPGIRTRTYSLDTGPVFTAISKLVQDRGWDVLGQTEPQTGLADGQINALATALGGWRDEVAIRVSDNGDSTVADMRSAALSPGPDFGANGRRIEEFLADLDAQVARQLRDASPNGGSSAQDEVDSNGAPLPAPPPSPDLQGGASSVSE